MKSFLFVLPALYLTQVTLWSAVLFSTGWDNPASTTTDSVLITGNATAQSIAITGNGTNQPAPNGFWTVTNAAQVDLSSTTLITNGVSTVGAASGNDILRKGAIFTTGTDFGHVIGATNSTIRYATNTGVWAPQFNSTAVNDGYFNVLFDIKSGVSLNGWEVSFNYGTAGTNGTWNNNTAAQNGTATAVIYSVDSGTGLLSSALTFGNTSLSGAGPLADLDASNMGTFLGTGTYLLSIQLTGKTLNQRYTIDNLTLSAVPEPGTYAMLVAGMAGLLWFRRKARNS